MGFICITHFLNHSEITGGFWFIYFIISVADLKSKHSAFKRE